VADPAPSDKDAGGADAAAGPLCTALLTCCVTIKSSGADSSTCEAAAAKHDETSCSKANDGYKAFGPCGSAGVECAKLSACCTQIKSSGSDSSVCEGAVAKHDEPACTRAYDGYKTFGPCT
jgi:hypothetical protein